MNDEKQIEATKHLNPLLFEESMDVYANSLDSAQFESLVILLANKQRMTTKSLQRAIEFSYIFEFLNELLDAVNDKAQDEVDREERTPSVKKRIRGMLSRESSDFDVIVRMLNDKREQLIKEALKDKSIKSTLLQQEALEFIGPLHGRTEFIADMPRFKNFILSKDPKYGNTEKKRTGVIKEINNHSGFKIPSYNTIDAGLEELRDNGYLEYKSAKSLEEKRTNASGVWKTSDILDKSWEKKRIGILEDYEKECSKAKAHHKDDWDALEVLIERYTPKKLDFYLVKVRERIQRNQEVSVYLKNQQHVSDVFRA